MWSSEYRQITAEAHADEAPGQYDVVTCMEMLEHVPDPASVLRAIATLVRPGQGVRLHHQPQPQSLSDDDLGAEYLLKMVPKGTHDHKKFITPAETVSHGEAAGLLVRDMSGVHYAPLSNSFKLGKNVDVNYMVAFRAPGARLMSTPHPMPLAACCLIWTALLLDTAPDLGAAVNHVLISEGFAPLSDDIIRQTTSHGALGLLRAGLGDELLEELGPPAFAPPCFDYYAANLCVRHPPL